MTEYILILAVLSSVIFMISPYVKQMFVGTPTTPGIATSAIKNQTHGFNEVNKGNIVVVDGCTPTGTSITEEECNKLAP